MGLPAIKQTQLLPHDIDTESAVLGSMIIEPGCIPLVIDKLQRADFYDRKNCLIFESIYKQFKDGHPTDLLTMTQAMNEAGTLKDAGGAYYMTQLMNRVNSTGNLERYVFFLNTYRIRREMIAGSLELQRRAFDITEDPMELPGLASELANTCMIKKNEDSNLNDLGAKFIADIENGVVNTGMTQGMIGPDQAYRWMKGEVHVIAGRPGMGKTAYMISAALNSAMEGNRIVIYTYEVTKEALHRRMLAYRASVSVSKLKHSAMNREEAQRSVQAAQDISDLPITIVKASGMTVEAIRAHAHMMKHKGLVDIIMIDHIGLVRLSQFSNDKTRGIGHVTNMLKQCALELDVSVVELCQLNRMVEHRPDKKPQLSDLKETGSIEEDADTVSFLYRPDYYGLNQENGEPFPKDFAIMIHAKSRDGETGETALSFNGEFSRYKDWPEVAFN